MDAVLAAPSKFSPICMLFVPRDLTVAETPVTDPPDLPSPSPLPLAKAALLMDDFRLTQPSREGIPLPPFRFPWDLTKANLLAALAAVPYTNLNLAKKSEGKISSGDMYANKTKEMWKG